MAISFDHGDVAFAIILPAYLLERLRTCCTLGSAHLAPPPCLPHAASGLVNVVGPFDNYGADLSGQRGVACGALLDSRDLPRSKRTQTIDNGTEHNLVVTYIELNENRMSKT